MKRIILNDWNHFKDKEELEVATKQ